MDKSTFFLWLNDTTHSRYYWVQPTKNWTTNFADATKFDTREAADDEAAHAEDSTTAEVVVQEMLVPA
jgi:hypothetical protein